MTTQAQKDFPMSVTKTGIYGIILGECRVGHCIRIRKIGARSIGSWSKAFWEECSEEEKKIVIDKNKG